MTRTRIITLSLLVIGASRQGYTAEQEQVQIQFEIFRISGDISGGTSLTDNVWRELEGSNPSSKKFPFSVFTIADQKLGGVKFETGKEGWLWDGKKDPPAGSRVTKVAAPRIAVVYGQTFQLSVSSQPTQPVQYFERRSDGLFELKTLKDKLGLSLSGIVTKSGDEGRVVFKDLAFTVRVIEKRKPLNGVSLDVGKPDLNVKNVKTTLSLKTAYDYGMYVWIRDGRGFLLCRIRAESPPKS